MSADVLSYRVPGMHCEKCERAVRDEVGQVAGVEVVEVDLESKLVGRRQRSLPGRPHRQAGRSTSVRRATSTLVQ